LDPRPLPVAIRCFGAKEHFALEAEFHERHGKWIYGAMRLWLDGAASEAVPWDEAIALDCGARYGRTFLAASPRRSRPELDGLPSAEVCDLLHGRHMVDWRGGPKASAREPYDWEPYLLDEVGESAWRDRLTLLAVRRADGFDRLLVTDLNTWACSEHLLPPGELDEVVRRFCAWVEAFPPP